VENVTEKGTERGFQRKGGREEKEKIDGMTRKMERGGRVLH
jgi:hypothetical protein